MTPRSPAAIAQLSTLGVQPAAGRLALAGDTALWAQDNVAVVATAGRDPVRLEVSFAIDRLELHPDGGHGLCVGDDGRRLAVLDLDRPAVAFQLGGADTPRHRMHAGFARLEDAAILLAAHKKGELHGYDLARRAPAFWVNVAAPLSFQVESIRAIDGDRVAILGHHAGDTLDTCEVISIADLAANPEALELALLERTGIRDSAVRLAAGPCDDGVVMFRDPGNNEDRDPDDDDPRGELEGFRGLYVRGHNGALRAHIDYDAPIQTGARLGGNRRWLVVECPAQIDIIDRASGAVHSLPADAAALDPHRLRVARAMRDVIELLDLGGSARLPLE